MDRMKTRPSKPTAFMGILGARLATSVKGWEPSAEKWRWWIVKETNKLESILAFKYSSKNIKYYEKKQIEKLIRDKNKMTLNQFLYRVNRLRARLGMKPLVHP